jgi:ABC-type dipeptide/oligopeptide/nickel transport system ATPase component
MQLPAVHPILEARDAAGGAAEAPTPRPAVVAVDLVKTYGSGEAAVTALGGVSASFTAGRFSVVVFADEPTGNLDSRAGQELLGLLRHSVTELGQTIVMVTHDPVAASHADGVLFLADGRLAGELEKPTVSAVLDRLGGLEEGR